MCSKYVHPCAPLSIYLCSVLFRLLMHSSCQAHAPPEWKKLVCQFISSTCFSNPLGRVYDLQLDHWGFHRQGTESYQAMYDRIASPSGPIDQWMNSNHHGFYDNSIEGVKATNDFCGPVPSRNIYFFTMSFKATVPFDRFQFSPEDISTFPWRPYQIAKLLPLPWFLVDGIVAFLANLSLNSGLFGNEGDLPLWVTNVANRKLRELGFPVGLPSPGTQIPRGDMLLPISPTGYGMGGYALTNSQRDILNVSTEAYQPNDGVVNTNSMRGPNEVYIQEIEHFQTDNANGGRGIFWHLGQNEMLDHADQIGAFTDENMVSSCRPDFVATQTLWSTPRS